MAGWHCSLCHVAPCPGYSGLRAKAANVEPSLVACRFTLTLTPLKICLLVLLSPGVAVSHFVPRVWL